MPDAEALRDHAANLSGAARLPWFERLLARMAEQPLESRHELLQASRRVMGARGVARPIDRLHWLAMRRAFGDVTRLSARPEAHADAPEWLESDVREHRRRHRVPLANGPGRDRRQPRGPGLVRHRHGDLAAVRGDPGVAGADRRGDGRGAGQDADAVVDAAAGRRSQLGRDRDQPPPRPSASATSPPMRCACPAACSTRRCRPSFRATTSRSPPTARNSAEAPLTIDALRRARTNDDMTDEASKAERELPAPRRGRPAARPPAHAGRRAQPVADRADGAGEHLCAALGQGDPRPDPARRHVQLRADAARRFAAALARAARRRRRRGGERHRHADRLGRLGARRRCLGTDREPARRRPQGAPGARGTSRTNRKARRSTRCSRPPTSSSRQRRRRPRRPARRRRRQRRRPRQHHRRGNAPAPRPRPPRRRPRRRPPPARPA